MNQSITLTGSGTLRGRYTPPGDKSVSHRAIMFGALAQGPSHFTGFLEAEDCVRTLEAFRAMGVPITWKPGSGEVTVQGVGMQGLKPAAGELDLGNSGTSMRLILGILAGQRFETTMTGDASLCSRPMKRVTQPLKQMGAQIKGKDQGNFAPLTIRGGNLKGIEFENKLGSAQVKSALLLAGMYAAGPTRIHEWLPSRDHTERMLLACGARFRQDGNILQIETTEHLKPFEMAVPGDISSAAFFIVGAAMTPGSELTVEKVGLNPFRTGLVNVLKRMGAKIEIQETSQAPEPIGHLKIEGRKLKGTRITKEEIPSLIDELPILMIAMALAEGESLITGAEELRVKETDRIHSMVHNLQSIGAQIEELPDGCLIRGVEQLQAGKAESFGDHRTAMSFAIASLSATGAIEIDGIDCIATSFPSFFDHFEALRRVRKS